MTHSYVRHDSFVCAIRHIDIMSVILRMRCTWLWSPLSQTPSWFIHMCSMTMRDTAHWYYECDVTSVMHLVVKSFVTNSVMTHSYVRCDYAQYGTLILWVWYYEWDVFGSDVFCHALRHDSFICAMWLIHITHSYGRHDSCIRATWLIHMRDAAHWYYECDALGSNVLCHELRHDSFICAMWLCAIRHIDIMSVIVWVWCSW